MNAERGEALAKVKAFHIEKLIFPRKLEEIEIFFIGIIDKIIDAKKLDAFYDTSDVEVKIDLLIYESYCLTEEKIKIVEGEE